MMMKRRLLLCLLLLLPAASALHAQRLSWSVEWGFTGTFFSYHDLHYTTLEGYHMDPRFYDNDFHTNGFLGVQLGVGLSERLQLALCTGYYGMQYDIRSIPAGLRGTWAFGSMPDGRGVSGFLEAGIGFSDENGKKNADYARLGASYDLPLGAGVRLRFLAAGVVSLAHPVPYDPFDEQFVDPERVGRSNRLCVGLSVGTAISF